LHDDHRFRCDHAAKSGGESKITWPWTWLHRIVAVTTPERKPATLEEQDSCGHAHFGLDGRADE
jgi:hypothetical protein